MSHWDFGRPPPRHRDAAPSGAGDAGGVREGRSADDFWAPGDRRPAEDDWAQDEGTAPYPITYERDAPDAAYSPWPPAPYPAERDAGADSDSADRTERWSDHDEPGHDDSYLPGGGVRRGRRGRPGPSRRGRGHAGPPWLR